jgi:prostamide/prostaglandin F2alpha synthase
MLKRLLGAATSRQEARAPGDATGLADLVVRDLDGSDVRLGSLWEDKPAVLVWLRHYG